MSIRLIRPILLVILLLLLSACGPPQSEISPLASGNVSGNITPYNPPPMPSVPQPPFPDKDNPKLDTFLNQLIAADKRGEADSFARQRAAQLVDGKVKVEIEAMPGQLDVATNITASVGAVGVIGRHINIFDATLPIKSLESLASAASIRIIRNPIRPVFP